MRHRVWLLLMGAIFLVGSSARVAGQGTLAAADDRVTDYRGKGMVTVMLEEAPGKEPVSLAFQMEQIFRKPGTVLLTLNLFGAGLRQSFLAEGSVEQSYNPVQGIIVEKRFKNLDRSATNPLIAHQGSMYDLGRRVRAARNRRAAGADRVLEFDCEVVELESKELFQDLATGGIFSGQRGEELRNGRTKVWLIREYGLPIRLEIYNATSPMPAMTLAFTELKVNVGVGNGELRLDAPPGTRKVSVTADLADPNWEEKMEDELRTLIDRALGTRRPAGLGGS